MLERIEDVGVSWQRLLFPADLVSSVVSNPGDCQPCHHVSRFESAAELVACVHESSDSLVFGPAGELREINITGTIGNAVTEANTDRFVSHGPQFVLKRGNDLL